MTIQQLEDFIKEVKLKEQLLPETNIEFDIISVSTKGKFYYELMYEGDVMSKYSNLNNNQTLVIDYYE